MTNGPRTRCPVCSSHRLSGLPFGYVFKERTLSAVMCSACDIIFLVPRPTDEDIRQLYSREYFEHDFRCGHTTSYFDPHTHSAIVDRELIARLRARAPARRLLEVGCAGGALLDALRSAGFQTTGVELSEDASRFAREHFRLDVRTGTLAAQQFPAASFDVVFAGDVLEHLSDPVAFLTEVHRVMAPGGLLVVACPTQTNTLFSRLGFFVYGLLHRRATVRLPPYHLFEYRPSSLGRLLRRCGFSVERTLSAILSPRAISLRGTPLENLGKKMLQYPNVILTRWFGLFGDRVEVHARR